MSTEPHYIGDGVYVRHDGYQFWLETLAQHPVHRIALEPPVFQALLAYRDRLLRGLDEQPIEGGQ